ncbi:MAG: zinc-binding dehydrogenase [Candidatus Omnitrophica bacterium]|nr:zinc-binding dehydrogenase [Candidatus Omnitrophota bacterium]
MFRTIHAARGDGFARGSLRPIVGKELPLAQAVEAHRAVMRPPAYGNIVLIPSS